MIGALLYLRLTSLRNLLVFRIRRLRQPKYLIGTVVAVLYLYFILMRRPGMAAADQVTVAADAGKVVAIVICVVASAMALLRIAFAWIAPAENPGLRFSEAEIAFLFPAPITRRALIHFRLLSAQLAILFTSFLIVFFFRRFGNTGNRLQQTVGWWLILSIFDLHLNGTNLTLARMKETGARQGLWRLAAVTAIVLYACAVVASATSYVNAHAAGVFTNAEPLGRVLQGLVDSSPLRWLILPFGLVFAPYFAHGLADFGLALFPALGVLALHYFWVAGSQFRFEEGSIALAERRAAARAALLRGEAPRIGASRRRALPGPFPLSPRGLPEVAFLWKNLLSMRSSLLSRRVVLMSLWVIGCLSVAGRSLIAGQARANGADYYGPTLALVCAMVAGYTLLVGPQLVRQDLRSDLPNMDILKTYPVEGWRLVLGELLAPTAVLSLILWLCVLVSVLTFDSKGDLEWLTPGVRAVAALCLGCAAPVLCFLLMMVPNALMLLMPGMYQATRSRGGGIELMGQRMILGLGQLLVALFVAAPACAAAVLVVFSSHWILGVGPALVLALLAVLTILGSEAAVGLWWLGERFERFDLSVDAR